MSASEKGHTDVIRILIEAGASRNITKDKVQVLTICTKQGSYNYVPLHTLTYLQDEVTALHIAVGNGHVEAVEVLTHKMNMEDINARDNVSHTIA